LEDSEDASGELEARQLRCLSVLSVVLENTTLSTDDNAATTPFFQLIILCVESLNEVVRQAAISCLTRYAILCRTPDTIASDIRPVLCRVAKNEEEIIEVRAQALLGISDLHAIFPDEAHSVDFSELLSQLLGYENDQLKVIAAECCAKSLLSKSLRNGNEELLARLAVYYFELDASIRISSSSDNTDTEVAAMRISDIGNPARLQQLLSLFFPAFCMGGHDNRKDFARSLKPLVQLVTPRTASKQVKKLPIAKMIDYVCSTIELAQDATGASQNNSTTEIEKKKRADESDNNERLNDNRQPKSRLLEYLVLALTSVSEVLLESRQHMAVATMRALCKKLGTKGAHLADLLSDAAKEGIESDIISLVVKLRENIEELEGAIDDHYAAGPLEDLEAVLSHVKEPDEESPVAATSTDDVVVDRDDDEVVVRNAISNEEDDESGENCDCDGAPSEEAFSKEGTPAPAYISSTASASSECQEGDSSSFSED
jgi:hypothetical protein